MNRYRANEVLSVAAQLAVLSQTMDQGNGGTAALDALSLTAADVPGLASDGSLSATTTNGVTTISATKLTSDDVGSAIKSIAGGNGTCAAAGCTLKMDGGRLTVS